MPGPSYSTNIANQRADSHPPNHRQLGWAILAFVLLTSIRLAAAAGDLEIDEIWSLGFVQHATKRFVDLFALRHDNNHLLNSMILYCLGPHVPGMVYRIPAVIASIGTVWLAGRLASRRGGFPSIAFAWLFVGASYLLILYGSEARGYAYAVFFAYLSWLLLQRTESSGRGADAAMFAASACLGFLSHLTFLYCYAGFFVWTIWKFFSKPRWILPLAHVAPLAFAGSLYLFFIRGMMIGGGPETNVLTAVISTLSIILGGPQTGDAALIAAACMTFLIGFGLYRLWKIDNATAACFLTIIVLAPAGVLLLTGHALIYPRYFLVPVAFVLLLVSETMANLKVAGWTSYTLRFSIIGVYLVGNLWWTAQLLDHGRGDYSQALAWMAKQGPNPATVSSDHDFRNGIVFEYNVNRLWPDNSPLRYVPQQSVTRQGTDWVILHDFEGDPPFPETVTDSAGNKYQWKRTYRHHSLTGWNWWIYRRNGDERSAL